MTTFYYDSNSQYYFDSKTNKYVYWSSEHQTYLPVPDASSSEGDKKDGNGKKDKVKSAKKIAKDMEKWARTMNQKKEAEKEKVQSMGSSSSSVPSNNKHNLEGGSEDIAFSIMQKRDNPSSSLGLLLSKNSTRSDSNNLTTNRSTGDVESASATTAAAAAPSGANTGLAGLAGYGSEGSDDERSSSFSAKEEQLTDWNKLACLLCKRQFPSKEKLTK